MTSVPTQSSSIPEFGVYGMPASKVPSAWKYYRIDVPLRTIHKLGLAHIYQPSGDDPAMDNDAMLGASVVIAWQLFGDNCYRFARLFRDKLPEFVERPDGVKEYRPLLVMDSDDALDLCDPYNPSYATIGVRNWNGDFLNPGDTVTYPMKDGTEMPLWVDKQVYGQSCKFFDIARNLRDMALYYETARTVAGVTVTNETLSQIYRDEGVEEVYVFPNSIIPEDYPTVQLAPHEGGPRLLWEGGSSHMGSWMSIKEPLLDTLRANPDVTLVVFGESPKGLKDDVRPEQLETHNWIDYAAYKFKRVMLNADINLCPLQNTPFNECKSAIRWYEGCMSPTPEPTLASNVGPYREIEDGRTGLLYNNDQEFREKLQSLIDNPELRHSLGEEGQKWVLANRHAEKTVPGLMQFYQHLKDKQRTADVRRTLAAGV